jgi:hypothetical protein
MRPNPILMILAGAVAVYSWGLNLHGWPHPWADRTFGILLNKPALGYLRLVDFAAVAYLVGILAAAFPRLLAWRPFELLGRHSLAVVAGQSVVVMVLLQFPVLFATPLANWVTSASAIGFLFVVAGLHEWIVAKKSQRAAGFAQVAAARHPRTSPQLS